MKTKEEILKILKDEKTYLRETYGIIRIGLFGSYVRGQQTTESDIDLLVYFEGTVGFFKFLSAEEYLKGKLGAKVEFVTEDALKPIMKPYITKEVTYA